MKARLPSAGLEAAPLPLKHIRVIAPTGGTLDNVFAAGAWPPFAEEVVEFVAALSATIMRGEEHRRFPELVAFAYEMRHARLKQVADALRSSTPNGLLRGRGVALHFAPANVDTIFLYSFVLSLLAGNTNIVRLSNRASPQIDLVIGTLNALMGEARFERVAKRIAVVRFDHDEAITRTLSARADVRVIWGGDATVETIRRMPIPPLAQDVAFPDRWSLAVFDAAAIHQADDLRSIARDFANDAYWFGQMACSSPRLIIWRGSQADAEKAADALFPLLEVEAGRHAQLLAPVDYVNKRIFEDETAIRTRAHVRVSNSNLLTVVRLPPDDVPRRADFCGGGAFIETRIDALADLAPMLDRRVQTVVSYGITQTEWKDALAHETMPGIDRIVPPGRALAFEFVWDGMDLLRQFTRETTVSA